MLHDELQYFIDNQEALLKRYEGKVLVIKSQAVIGEYDSVIEAYLEVQETHELGTFLIQKCEPGPGAYTVTVSTVALGERD